MGLSQSPSSRRTPLTPTRRTGSPAIEFALLAPVMIYLLTASYDITQSLIAQCQVTRTAHQIVEIATQLSIKPDMSMSLTTIQAYQAQTAIYALIPGLKLSRDINKFSVTLSVVVFIPSQPVAFPIVNCSFIARTAWSNALPEGIRITRPCGASHAKRQLISPSQLISSRPQE